MFGLNLVPQYLEDTSTAEEGTCHPLGLHSAGEPMEKVRSSDGRGRRKPLHAFKCEYVKRHRKVEWMEKVHWVSVTSF